MTRWCGLVASPGVAAGRAWVHRPRGPTDGAVPPTASTDPRARFRAAMKAVERDLTKRCARLRADGTDPEWLALIEAHRMMLADPLFQEHCEARLKQEESAERVITEAVATLGREALAARPHMPPDEFSAWMDDLEQVGDRIRAALQRQNIASDAPPMHHGCVLVARSVSPEALLEYAGIGAECAQGRIRALCLDGGGPLMHTAILARHLGIPTVVGLGDLSTSIQTGVPLIVDAYAAAVTANPSPAAVHQLRAAARARPASSATGAPLHRRDLWVLANLHAPEEGPMARAAGVDGVGLLRTDGLLGADGSPPAEIEQADRYRELVIAMGGRPVTIRLFDGPPSGPNPALGIRGVRWALTRPEMMCSQLRAVCRAAVAGPVRVVVGMVTHPDEVRTIRAWLAQAWTAVGDAGPPPQLGCMIETPAAGLLIREILEVTDFVTVGTNDLGQYLMAADRESTQAARYLDPAHPALWRMLEDIAAAAKQADKPAIVCGELAGQPGALHRLIDVGYRAVSVAPNRAIELRRWLATDPGALDTLIEAS